MDANRKAAYFTLVDVESKKSYSNIALNHHIKLSRPNSPAFVRELVYGVLENKMLLDYIIDQLVPTGTAKMRVNDLVLLRIGIYQLSSMDSVPEYAAVNESVILAKKYAKGREGFINAVLRHYIKSKDLINLPDRRKDEVSYLSTKYSYEPWIVELWLDQYTPEFVEEMLKAGNKTPETTIRLNWLKVMKPDLIRQLRERGYEVEEGKVCENALHVKGSGLLETALYKAGLFSVQDEASMLVSVMMEPQHGDVVMDLCAAPGGKTLAIAERMNNTGKIYASDVYKRKLTQIDNEAKRLGITNIETYTWDATKINSEMVEKADKVLVDVPCSGLGVVRRKPEIKYKKYTEELDTLPQKQLAILSASSAYVKPGGVLIYSTCTINPYENQRVTSEFLRKNKSFRKEESIQLLPNVNGTDGFYICKMRKENNLV
ncbi:MAG: 16S rRNA (cytosine(967)-C(5))-methyltransferase RsmB [Firmicutes bacterium]|nr:16S rRNA (cytosine(967)-C(5))-methyltransferase RsmB [Bacillota bacterium]